MAVCDDKPDTARRYDLKHTHSLVMINRILAHRFQEFDHGSQHAGTDALWHASSQVICEQFIGDFLFAVAGRV